MNIRKAGDIASNYVAPLPLWSISPMLSEANWNQRNPDFSISSKQNIWQPLQIKSPAALVSDLKTRNFPSIVFPKLSKFPTRNQFLHGYRSVHLNFKLQSIDCSVARANRCLVSQTIHLHFLSLFCTLHCTGMKFSFVTKFQEHFSKELKN